MPSRRDRHQRGMRGPLAALTSVAGQRLRRQRPLSAASYFVDCVSDALARISDDCPQALPGVDIGLEDVPTTEGPWTAERVPLAAALEATPDRLARIVVYRRPIEHRASTRKQLRNLVYRTIVEQVSALTGIPTDTIDPHGHAQADEDDD